MKLEEGKFYRTKAGRKVGPMRNMSDTWDQVGCDQVWHQDGTVMLEGGDESHDYIVAEWKDDAPKLWRDMTAEEKGALLLAHHEGKVIENTNGKMGDWEKCPLPGWFDDIYYRVRPEPKWETVTVHYSEGGQFTKLREAHTTRRITLPLTDGTVPAGIYLNTEGRAIVVEELE